MLVQTIKVGENSVTDPVLSTKRGWRINEWSRDTGIGRAYIYELLKDGVITSVKIGGMRIITTSPEDYLRSAAA